MKIAVIGASGLIGSHLLAHLRQSNSDTVGTSFSKKDSELTFFDIRSSNLDSLALEDQGYSSVIITAALSNIYFCETNAALSHEVNVRGTLTLLEQLAKTSLQSIFLSSDYVFDGKTGSYTETSPTNPTTEYGKQKNIVEKVIPTLTDNYLIVRASKIFGTTRNDGTFIDNIAKDLSAGKKIRVAYDQIFCPTFVEEFATSLLYLIENKEQGVRNICNPEQWSRARIATTLASYLGVDLSLIESVPLDHIPILHNCPLNTSMVCSLSETERQRLFSSFDGHLKNIAKQWRLN